MVGTNEGSRSMKGGTTDTYTTSRNREISFGPRPFWQWTTNQIRESFKHKNVKRGNSFSDMTDRTSSK
jgi:hypothetical protein